MKENIFYGHYCGIFFFNQMYLYATLKKSDTSWSSFGLQALIKLTWKFEFSAARVAVMFGAEVTNGIVSKIRRAKDHIIRPVAVKHKNNIHKLYNTLQVKPPNIKWGPLCNRPYTVLDFIC